MFSRIMMASQSPKKCKPEDMTSSEQNRIVQTSSDDDFVLSAKEEEKKEDGSHRGRLSFHSNSQSSCNEAESKKEQKRKRFVLRESESLSLSERSTESSDTGSSASESSDSDLFDKEEESQPVIAKTVINRKIISTQPEKQVLSESIEDDSCVLMPRKSYKRSFPSLPPAESKSPVRRAWKTTPRSPPSSPSKRKFPAKVVDIYSYVPAFDALAINPLHKQQFQDWVLRDDGNSLCVLFGPPGSCKVALTARSHR